MIYLVAPCLSAHAASDSLRMQAVMVERKKGSVKDLGYSPSGMPAGMTI